MDYNRWVEMQQHLPPNPNPPIHPYTHYYNNPQTSHHFPYHPTPQSQNPNPHHYYYDPQIAPDHHGYPSTYPDSSLLPPGIDSVPSSSYQVPPVAAVAQAPPYYQDPNAVSQYWAAKEVVRQFGADPFASSVGYFVCMYSPRDPFPHSPCGFTESFLFRQALRIPFKPKVRNHVAILNHVNNKLQQLKAEIRPPNLAELSFPTNPHANRTSSTARRPNDPLRKWPKKVKTLQQQQHAWCEVCKVDCNSKDVLDKHLLGKKHKKNVEKLQELTRNPLPVVLAAPAGVPLAPVSLAPTPVFTTPAIGPQVKPTAFQQAKKKHKKKKVPPTLASGEDLETKRRKVVGEGAATDAVRVCAICNVVCNSQIVFNYHLAGKMHIAMVKKQENGTAGPVPNVVTAA
ncbi:hypothetical protein GIB67_007225 [Kingdonia uniflora]|uniref:U1-type domain-containing protein n=1 Tax=Kingdonia uniflora TaxID=39325 RepID=A0A7J7NXM6_9MAGN|nr:hypothetical protein GIB67_007225 [Kingdonia uniflora]